VASQKIAAATGLGWASMMVGAAFDGASTPGTCPMAVTRLGEAPPGDETAQRWDNGATLSLGQRLSFDSKKARGGGGVPYIGLEFLIVRRLNSILESQPIR
jgi:hypothetical protein